MCARIWILYVEVTINEMVIPFKETFYTTSEYLLSKSIKWGIKLWSFVKSNTKFKWDFNVYCWKGINIMEKSRPTRRCCEMVSDVKTDMRAHNCNRELNLL